MILLKLILKITFHIIITSVVDLYVFDCGLFRIIQGEAVDSGIVLSIFGLHEKKKELTYEKKVRYAYTHSALLLFLLFTLLSFTGK